MESGVRKLSLHIHFSAFQPSYTLLKHFSLHAPQKHCRLSTPAVHCNNFRGHHGFLSTPAGAKSEVCKGDQYEISFLPSKCSKILLVSSLLNVQNTEIITRNGINHHHFELSTKRRFCTAGVNKKKFLPSS